MVRADLLEEQWTDIISAIKLPEDWKQRIEELAGDRDQRQRILREREEVQEKLRRLKLMCVACDDAPTAGTGAREAKGQQKSEAS
jgi:hypothetical protein